MVAVQGSAHSKWALFDAVPLYDFGFTRACGKHAGSMVHVPPAGSSCCDARMHTSIGACTTRSETRAAPWTC
jgi:hypothetical protein